MVANTPKFTVIKFKRLKTSYVVPVGPEPATVDSFKNHVEKAINNSGGLSLIEPEQTEEDDIPVPKSEFNDDMIEQDNNTESIQVKPEQLRLAVPKDKTSPYDNQWIEITDDAQLSSISFNDYDIIAFAYGDENFEITEAVYEE